MRHYLDGLASDLKKSLLQQLKVLWAYNSTALEGNSLTLGETHDVLTEGLTINGKPLKDHNEVVGHARAEDLMEALLYSQTEITEKHLFELHQAVQTNLVNDAYQPIGSWKMEPNSTIVVLNNKQIVNDTYARPSDVPVLMSQWLESLNQFRKNSDNEQSALKNYTWLHTAFVRIHPFADGNGRMARLLANIPVLVSGLPPVVIVKENRSNYIRALAAWQLSLGRPEADQPLITQNDEYQKLEQFFHSSWEPTKKLVHNMFEVQKNRI